MFHRFLFHRTVLTRQPFSPWLLADPALDAVTCHFQLVAQLQRRLLRYTRVVVECFLMLHLGLHAYLLQKGIVLHLANLDELFPKFTFSFEIILGYFHNHRLNGLVICFELWSVASILLIKTSRRMPTTCVSSTSRIDTLQFRPLIEIVVFI